MPTIPGGGDPAPLSDPAVEHAADFMQPGQTVGVVGGARALEAALRLRARGCEVTVVAHPEDLSAAAEADVRWEGILLVEGFESLGDPVAALRRLATGLAAGGQMVALARSAPAPTDDPTPPRRYDRASLDLVVAAAGLVPVDRLQTGEEPAVTHLVVARTAPTEPISGPGVAERLQVELEAAGGELVRLRREQRHLVLDAGVKDAYIIELRAEIDDSVATLRAGEAGARQALTAVQAETARLAAEVAGLQRALAEAQSQAGAPGARLGLALQRGAGRVPGVSPALRRAAREVRRRRQD